MDEFEGVGWFYLFNTHKKTTNRYQTSQPVIKQLKTQKKQVNKIQISVGGSPGSGNFGLGASTSGNSASTSGDIIFCVSDKRIRLWSVNKSKVKKLKSISAHSQVVSGILLFKNYFISSSEDKSIKVWDQSTKKCVSVLVKNDSPITCMTIKQDESKLFFGSADGSIKSVSLEGITSNSSNEDPPSVLIPPSGSTISNLHFVPFSVPQSSNPLSSNCQSQNQQVYAPHQSPLSSPHRNAHSLPILVSSSIEESSLKLWNLEKFEYFLSLPGHTDKITCISSNDFIQQIISSSLDGTIKFWSFPAHTNLDSDSNSFVCLSTIDVKQSITCFDSNNHLLIAGLSNGTVLLFDLFTHAELRKFENVIPSSLPVTTIILFDNSFICSGSKFIKIYQF